MRMRPITVLVIGLTACVAVAVSAIALDSDRARAATPPATVYAVTPIDVEAGALGPTLNSADQVAMSADWGSCCSDSAWWAAGHSTIFDPHCSKCGDLGSGATGINGAGQITGAVSYGAADQFRGYRYQLQTGTAVILPTLVSGGSVWPTGINGAGQIVGHADVSGGASHAFLWDGTAIHDLGTLGGSSSTAEATYATGQAVGCTDTAGGHQHPFLYQGGTMTDLGLPAGMTDGCAVSVNASVTILGWATDSANSKACATWLWSKTGGFQILPKLDGQCISVQPGHISNTGQVVGSVQVNGNAEPAVYQHGVAAGIGAAQTPFDPPSSDPGVTPGWDGYATSNNLHGLITLGGINEFAYLLTPITVYDETNAAIKYSGAWTRVAQTGAYGGHVESTSKVGAAFTLTFTGKSISVIGTTGPGLGSALVTIDGKADGTLVEGGNPATRARLDTVYFATRGTHTITVTCKVARCVLDAVTVAPY